MISEMIIEAPTEQQLVAMIHEEFDTAPERLLKEAPAKIQMLQAERDQLLGRASAVDPALKAKVDRLKKMGFTNTADSQLLDNQKAIDQNNRTHIRFLTTEERNLTQLSGLIAYYRESYRFATFLTIEELDRICEKYGLIHAPASTYIGQVPDKNLKEIENAQPLKARDLPEKALQLSGGLITLSMSEALGHTIRARRESFNGETVVELLAYLERHSDLFTGEALSNSLLYAWATPMQEQWPNIWESSFSRSIQENAPESIHQIDDFLSALGRSSRWARPFRALSDVEIRMAESKPANIFSLAPITGFHIAAPPKQFKLDKARVVKAGKYGYVVDNDPIVFRYCRGGILVDSKWGLEASDPALINPTDN